jgi:hypothetical protein
MLERKALSGALQAMLEWYLGRQRGFSCRHCWEGQRSHNIWVNPCSAGNLLCRHRVDVEVQGGAMRGIDFDMGQQFRVITVVGGSQPRQPT